MARPGQCCGAPAPPPTGTPSAGWDAMSGWYTSTVSPATASLALSLLGHLGLLADGEGLRVLETHCGDAQAAARLLPAPAVSAYTCCDFSGGMLEGARAKLGERATVVEADSMALPYTGGSFDRYISNMGCCCVADLDAKLREAHRVLAEGGIAAMSMRIEGGDGDTAFRAVGEALRPFGFPPGPDREGLRLGKDLPALRAKLQDVGFKGPVAWRTWVTLPVHDEEAFLAFATGQPPVAKFLGGLEEGQREEALQALREKGRAVLSEGAVQIAVAAVVAKK